MTKERADTFRDALVACFDDCKHRAVALERLQGFPEDSADEREEFLECHIRRYVIDHCLAGLGWRIPAHRGLAAHSQNIEVEVGLESVLTSRRRFLDYFGFEKRTGAPLLVVEAKRPSLALPGIDAVGFHFACHPASALFAEYLQTRHDSLECSDKIKTALTIEWRRYLDDLRDYVQSAANVTTLPKRVVLTNGDWLVLFTSPEQSFYDEDARVLPSTIHIFENRSALVAYYSQVYSQLSYAALATEVGVIQPLQLPALVSFRDVSCAMYGQRILYCRDRTLYSQVPRIELTPVLHLITASGGFLTVESDNRYRFELGRSADNHINAQRHEIARAAEALKQEVEQVLAVPSAFPLRDISDHYQNRHAFANLPGVQRVPGGSASWQEFIFVTGCSPHFLTDPSNHSTCRYHDSAAALSDGVLHSIGTVHTPTTDPAAFFPSSSFFHCSHRMTFGTKQILLSDVSRLRAGPRSGADNEPFCELFQLDQVLCCRTCVFEQCCAQSDLFRLPCQQ